MKFIDKKSLICRAKENKESAYKIKVDWSTTEHRTATEVFTASYSRATLILHKMDDEFQLSKSVLLLYEIVATQ